MCPTSTPLPPTPTPTPTSAAPLSPQPETPGQANPCQRRRGMHARDGRSSALAGQKSNTHSGSPCTQHTHTHTHTPQHTHPFAADPSPKAHIDHPDHTSHAAAHHVVHIGIVFVPVTRIVSVRGRTRTRATIAKQFHRPRPRPRPRTQPHHNTLIASHSIHPNPHTGCAQSPISQHSHTRLQTTRFKSLDEWLLHRENVTTTPPSPPTLLLSLALLLIMHTCVSFAHRQARRTQRQLL